MCAEPLGWPKPVCLSVNAEITRGREPAERVEALPVPGDSGRDGEALEVLPAARLNQRGGWEEGRWPLRRRPPSAPAVAGGSSA